MKKATTHHFDEMILIAFLNWIQSISPWQMIQVLEVLFWICNLHRGQRRYP
jgi:hypothetical protein